jgi:ABC-2 type transport system ATP-binding protein
MLTNSLDATVAQRPAAQTPQSHVVSPDNETVIRVRGLRKHYDGREAVKGIDLDVRRGEIFAFLGPNGAGKTTTVEILEGFRQASDGVVEVLGKNPWRAPSAWRERIGAVLQESEAEPGLTVRECLQMYAGYYRAPRGVDETLALAQLSEQADERATALSGGQRRRLDVALALIGDPELVFLDEPTTGFDPSARRAAWTVIAGLRELGKTVFLTTHYMEEAERLADRIAIIAGGEIVAQGTPRTLGGRELSRVRVTFALPAGTVLDELPASIRARAEDDGGGRLTLRDPRVAADLQTLSGWALARELELEDVEVHRPTLEDVYLQLTADGDSRTTDN